MVYVSMSFTTDAVISGLFSSISMNEIANVNSQVRKAIN